MYDTGVNYVTLTGKVIEDFVFDHESHGKRMFKGMVSIKRKSQVEDIIPVYINKNNLDLSRDYTGEFVAVTGCYVSYNLHDEENISHLKLYVRAYSLTVKEDQLEYENIVELNGYICQKPKLRKTPSGRVITDLFIAVNILMNRPVYIPLIAWKETAKHVSRYNVGDQVRVLGRIQSRDYKKKISDTETEIRTAYEVSVSAIQKENACQLPGTEVVNL